MLTESTWNKAMESIPTPLRIWQNKLPLIQRASSVEILKEYFLFFFCNIVDVYCVNSCSNWFCTFLSSNVVQIYPLSSYQRIQLNFYIHHFLSERYLFFWTSMLVRKIQLEYKYRSRRIRLLQAWIRKYRRRRQEVRSSLLYRSRWF